MRRRSVVAGIGATFAWPLAARAQQPRRLPVVGFLNPTSPGNYSFNFAAFRDGLREAGYVEDRNIVIEARWGSGNYERLPSLAAELVARGVDVIAATGDIAAARAAQAATRTIPIVFTIGGDPVRFGLVASVSRPGGNTTGVMSSPNNLGAKRLEVLCEAVPSVRSIGLIMNPGNVNAAAEQADAEAGARTLGRQSFVAQVRSAGEFETAIARLVEQGADGFMIATDPLLLSERDRLAALAIRHGKPAISFVRELAAAGVLMTYGTRITDMYHQAGVYAGRILDGANPAELPVMQSHRFETIINLRTARSLGITIAQSILQRADEVIE
jgi:putative ABC transport system substrate-binding protein